METLAFLLILPLLWPFVAKALWKHEIVAWEIAANIAIGALVVLIGWYGGRVSLMADREVVNGQVTQKESHRVTCNHSYSCNCYETCTTRSDGSRSCSQSCSTCYEHAFDVNYTLMTTVGNLDINRVDRQGIQVPPRFSIAAIGDPVARTRTFDNYVRAAPHSLFNSVTEQAAYKQFENMYPKYPDATYDYHYINRVLVVGAKVPDAAEYNKKLALALRTLGPEKQANAIFVFSGSKDPLYAEALRANWLGAKKNDIVVVMGTPNYPEVEWVKVISWTDNQLFKVQLADAILELKTLTPDVVVSALAAYTQKMFQRKHMRDFEYLKWEIELPTWLIILLVLSSLAASVGASFFFSTNEFRNSRNAG